MRSSDPSQKSLTLLVKPASSLCQLRCRYCFYEDLSTLRQVKSSGIMARDTAGTLLRQAFAAARAVHILFQGGEPTLAGLDFFRFFVREAKALCPRGSLLSFAIQTNGMAVDEEWAAFFREEGFLVGLSLDGSRENHDRFRRDAQGMGTWDRALRALRLLEDAGVEVNLLFVVTGPGAKRPQRLYRSLRELGDHPLQFIPCLEPLEAERGLAEYALSPQAWGRFLCGVFDCWYAELQAGRYVSIRQFDDYLRILYGMEPGSCAACGRCGSYLAVESDGGLYPCDFFVLDRWRLGRLGEITLEEALDGDRAREFRNRSQIRPNACVSCPHEPLCRGGCPRDWQWNCGEPDNYLCAGYQAFFPYVLPRLQTAARRLAGK